MAHIRFHILPGNGAATEEQNRAADDPVSASAFTSSN